MMILLDLSQFNEMVRVREIQEINNKKRFRAYLSNGVTIDFGQVEASTYIDAASIQKRNAYRSRHMKIEKERSYLEGCVISPALLSYWILWGDSQDIDRNLKELNRKLWHTSRKPKTIR